MISMTLGCGVRQTLSQRQEQRLTQEQRVQIQELQFSARMRLMEVVYGEKYQPEGICPECKKHLSAVEILKGFTDDPLDVTTLCPRCGYRFRPRLVHSRSGIRVDMPFYCAVQVLDMLRGKDKLSANEIMRTDPAIYHSALVHFGTLHNAFSKTAVRYEEPSPSGWRDKIVPFLGQIPDTIIAECVNTHVYTIRKMRKRLGIKRYTKKSSLE